MKATTFNQEAISLDKIEKNTNQILKKIDSIRPSFFSNNLKFSKKATQEKQFLFKILFPKKILGTEKIIERFIKILEDVNFSKLEKEDQDFILELDKMGFKKSKYAEELNALSLKEKSVDDAFFTFFMGETVYFNFLDSELRSIQYKLNDIRLKP